MLKYVLGISLLTLIATSSFRVGHYYGKTNKQKTDCVAVIDVLLNQMTPFVDWIPPEEYEKLQALIYARKLIEKSAGERNDH